MFFKAVAQAVLLFRVGDVGDDPPHGQGPRDFPAQIFQSEYGETSEATGGWDLGVPTARELEEMGEYVLKRHNTVATYIAARPIMDLCKETVKRYGVWVASRGWYQEGIYLAGARVAEAEDGEGESEREEEER